MQLETWCAFRVFDLQNSTGPLWTDSNQVNSLASTTNEAALIMKRWTFRDNEKGFPIFLSDLNGKSVPVEIASSNLSIPYERFWNWNRSDTNQIFYPHLWFIKNKTQKSYAAAFLQGKQYLVDVKGKLFAVENKGATLITPEMKDM